MKNKPEINSIYNGNVTLNTKIYSSGKVETIILLHGGPGVSDEMQEVVDILKDKYCVISFEQRGVGASKCKDGSFTMQDYISDIDAISDYYGLKQFHLFGHSWGGLYAQIYALERPLKIKSLFLCSPSSGTNKLWKKTEKEVMYYNKKHCTSTEWFIMGWNSLLGLFGSDKAYQKLFKQVLINYLQAYNNLSIEDEFLSRIHSQPINKSIKEIKKYRPLPSFDSPQFPIYITYGDNDIYGESRFELIKRYPTSEVKMIDKCGHIPWKNNLAEFEIILREFYDVFKV